MQRFLAITNFTALLLFAGLAVLLAGIFLPASVGYQVRMVTSGSMEPTIHLGSVVIVRPVADYQVGDIITFERSGEDATTHRIVSDEIASGVMQYRVKGDANDANDARAVPESEVLGKVLLTVPYLGYVLDFIRTPIGIAAIVLILLALYALGEMVKPKKQPISLKESI